MTSNEVSDKELADMFMANGLPRTVARTLACFKDNDTLTMIQIQARADLRQPEVSIATSNLSEKGWLSTQAVRRASVKGRPIVKLSLAKPFREIVTAVANDRSQEVKRMEENINSLLAVA
jgi:predicted transcriptional regulator